MHDYSKYRTVLTKSKPKTQQDISDLAGSQLPAQIKLNVHKGK